MRENVNYNILMHENVNLGSHWGFPTYRMTCSGQQKLYINDKKEPEIRDQASVIFFNKSAAKKRAG